MSSNESALQDLLVALEEKLSRSTNLDETSLKEILADAGAIVDAAPADDVARINKEVGELLEKHGVLPENPGAAG